MTNGALDCLVEYIMNRIKLMSTCEIPMGINGGKARILLLSSLLYKYSHIPAFHALSQNLFNELIKYYENHLISADKSFPEGLTGFVWSVGYMIKYGMIDDTVIIKERLNRLLSYKNGLDYSPVPVNINDVIFSDAIAKAIMLPEDKNYLHYTITEELIRHIDEIEIMLEFKDKRIFSFHDISTTFFLSLVLFLKQLRDKHIYPFKATRLCQILAEYDWDLTKASLAEKTLYHYLMNGRISFDGANDLTIDQKYDFLSEIGLFSILFSVPSLFEFCLTQPHYKNIMHDLEDYPIDDTRLINIGLGLFNCESIIIDF